jgi:hypothetical protein
VPRRRVLSLSESELLVCAHVPLCRDCNTRLLNLEPEIESRGQSYFTTGGLPPIILCRREAPWESRPVISFANWTLAVIVFMWHPLWREDISIVYNCCWSRQRSHSQVRVPRNSWPHFTFSDSRLLPTWRTRSPYLYPPGTGWPGYTPRHWLLFRRLLRLAGLRWKYWTPPPHGILFTSSSSLQFI